jgi:hypothetical protein
VNFLLVNLPSEFYFFAMFSSRFFVNADCMKFSKKNKCRVNSKKVEKAEKGGKRWKGG